jgi:hypothetical protein
MRIVENTFEKFVYFMFPLMIIFFGLIGNLLGLMALRKRKQTDSEIGPIYMYRFLFITDSIILISFINVFMDKVYSTGPYYFTNFSCNLLSCLTISLISLSSFILIYILIESYFSIKYPVESNLLKKKKPQFIYTITIFIFNLIYFLPIFFHYKLIQEPSNINNNNNNNNTTIISDLTCTVEPNEKHKIETLIFINRIVLPLILILFFSTNLIYNVCTSTTRMNTFYSERERKQFKKDVHLSIISILFNLFQYSFSMPAIIIFFILNDEYSPTFFLAVDIFHLAYAFNFYFLIIVNSLFRKEFYLIFNKSQTNISNIEMVEMNQRI